MTTKESTESVTQAAGIPWPKCHEAAGDLLCPDAGMLEFKCSACGHQWLLFDRSPQDDNER